jgi:hypothetical protein
LHEALWRDNLDEKFAANRKPFWRSRLIDDCRGATTKQAVF